VYMVVMFIAMRWGGGLGLDVWRVDDLVVSLVIYNQSICWCVSPRSGSIDACVGIDSILRLRRALGSIKYALVGADAY
jgi:hypothetical protein